MSKNRQFLVSLGFAALLALPAQAQFSFTKIAKVGDTAPGTGGATFSGFVGTPYVSGGNVALVGAWNGGADQGIFAHVGALTNIAKTGDAVPGTGGALFSGFGRAPGLSGSNLSLFGTWAGGSGVFRYSGGALSSVNKTGDAVPGTGGATFTSFGSAPSISGSNIAFQGAWGGGQGVFVGGSGGGTNIVKSGDAVPGLGGATFTEFGASPSIDNSNLVFSGSWGAGTQGIFTNIGGLTTLAATGAAVPGVGGATFSSFGATPVIHGTNIAFLGNWAGGSQGIFFSSGAGAPTLLAKTGDAVPGVGGATFAAFGAGSTVGGNNVSVSDNQVAFIGTWAGGGQGLFLSNGAGSPTLILKNGDSLFGSTVTNLSFGGGGLANPQLAFRYTLANGETGIATRVSSAPEPGTLALGLLGLGGLVLRRRKTA